MKTRQHLRVPLPVQVKVKVVGQDEDFKLAMLDDISWGGAFLIMEPPAPRDSRIVIQFEISDINVSLELWGTVVRTKEAEADAPGGVGVAFDDLDYDAQSLIQRMVNEEVRDMKETS